MKNFTTILYYVLALPFLIFGFNFFINFIPVPPMEGLPADFMAVMGNSGYMAVVKILEIVFAIMLIANLKRALVLLLLAPIIVNILLFEIFIVNMPGMGVILLLIVAFLIYSNRERYLPIVR